MRGLPARLASCDVHLSGTHLASWWPLSPAVRSPARNLCTPGFGNTACLITDLLQLVLHGSLTKQHSPVTKFLAILYGLQVMPSGVTLGSWLRSHGLPVLKVCGERV